MTVWVGQSSGAYLLEAVFAEEAYRFHLDKVGGVDGDHGRD